MTIHPHIAVDASAPASAPSDLIAFEPVPVVARQDGWTPEKQRAFIEALADTGCVQTAARMVGMGVEGAYRLRRRPDAAAFAEAWDAAYAMMTRRLADAAFARAIHGVTNPVFHKGELIGERVTFNEQLTRFLLERHDPRGHGHLHSADASYAAIKDPLPKRLARLPHLLARLFGAAGDPDPADYQPEEIDPAIARLYGHRLPEPKRKPRRRA